MFNFTFLLSKDAETSSKDAETSSKDAETSSA
jgi:hypothetical protein